MKQYYAIKAKYPGALLLFRVGDFYETFGEDAIKTSEILGIVLTKRANGAAATMELAGFPYHSLDTYLPKLVRAGQRVAICDQLEDPKQTKTIVKRGVTELVTPGVSYNDKVLESKRSNYLCSVYYDEPKAGVAFLDISTGEFMVSEGDLEQVKKLVGGFSPAEVLVSKTQYDWFLKEFGDDFCTQTIDEWVMQTDYCNEKLTRHFNTQNLKGFGIENQKSAVCAAGACLYYLEQTHHHHVGHITGISRIDHNRFVWLDPFTIRNLEILEPNMQGGLSLARVLDKTTTPMGSRLLRKWLVLPLKEMVPVVERHTLVNVFVQQSEISTSLREWLREIGDLERIISKVALARINPRELLQLGRSLKAVSAVQDLLKRMPFPELVNLASQIHPCENVSDTIFHSIKEDAPALISKGGVINNRIDKDLDELRAIAFSGKDYLLEMQKRETLNTGISSLKIAFNNVFGYYLEVTHAHKDKVPADWIRKQTLTSAERYVTPELKEYEEKIINAEDRISAIEGKLYEELVSSLSEFVAPIQITAGVVAKLDCLLSFAEISNLNKYVMPTMNEGFDIQLKNARHPVIEKQLPLGEDYIPNDTFLNNEDQKMIILTGPNMSGKSAILRQTALCVLMAQMGCFVPADSAEIGMVDKIYTRVGASDNISQGESTFMVEMTETASILNNLSNRSLIILDEIGRGTSTFDGVSLAWAIAEFLVNHPYKPKTLFATHYHELNELEEKFVGIKNYHISIKEAGQHIIFLRKLLLGGSEHSFGIHVARLAGIPKPVLERATEILDHLEKNRAQMNGRETLKNIEPGMQLSMFQLDDPVMAEIKTKLKHLDINTLSPVEALLKLQEIKNMVNK